MRIERSLKLPLFLSALLGLSLPAALGFAQGGGSVRYSYEKVEVNGTPSWVLVPQPEASLGTQGKEPSKGAVIGAFELLKKQKSKSYGNASIAIGAGRWPQGAAVTVTIDPKFAAYAPVVIAETVYTLTEMGLPGVVFAGYGSEPMTRADVPMVTYTLTLPMWQALPPARISPAQVLLPSGRAIDAETFYDRWAKKDPELVAALYGFLQSANAATVISVLRQLPALKLPYQKEVLPLLGHQIPAVRAEAATALVPFQKDAVVLAKVAEQLEREKDAATATALGAFLRDSGDKGYAVLDAVYVLRNANEAQAAAAATSLAAYDKSPVARNALVEALSSKSPAVATASADALGKMGAQKELLDALGNKKIPADQRLAMATALSSMKEEGTRIEGLGYVVENAPERQALKAIDELALSKDPGARKRLESLLASKDDVRQAAAARALAGRGEAESIGALAAAMKKGSGTAAGEIERAGYTVMLAQPMATIMEFTRAKDAGVQQLAYRALGEKASQGKPNRSVMETLTQGTTSKNDEIRGASARALGALATADVAKTLGQMGQDKSPQVRRDVALALANFKGGEQAELLTTLLEDKDGEVAAAAMYALGTRGEAGAWNTIKGYAKSKDPQVRASALEALTRLVSRDDANGVSEVISLLSGAVSDRDPEVQRRALVQLGTFNNENAVLSIASKLTDKEVGLRVEAVRALGKTGNRSAKNLLVRALNDQDARVREAAILALGDLKDRSAKKDLQAYAKEEKEADLKALATRVSDAL